MGNYGNKLAIFRYDELKLVHKCHSKTAEDHMDHYFLFNLTSDPRETRDLSKRLGGQKKILYERLKRVVSDHVPYPEDYFRKEEFSRKKLIPTVGRVNIPRTDFCRAK